MPDAQRRARLVGFRGVTLAVLAVVALTAGSAAAATLSPAELAFKTAYEKLVPTLNKASSALVHAVDGSSHATDAQVVTIFTGVARQWASATKPLLALHAPAREAQIFTAVARDSRAVEADLLAVAQSGRTNSVSAAKAAGTLLALDFNALARQIKLMKAKLGLP
jgi:hypothetical protein